MKKHQKPITYGIYVRKSTESEDRQVQSLVRQIGDLKNVIEREDLIIGPDVFQETHSAFDEGRPIFDELVRATKNGEINAWLCWHPNRLSRNPVDTGKILQLMDKGLLLHVRTLDQTFTCTPNDKFMLQMHFAMSKNDSEEKSVIVKSGIRRRAERGYPNGHPPIGFKIVNQTIAGGSSSWDVDEEAFPVVRKMFDQYLAGKDSILTLTSFLKAEGLKTTQRGKSGGKLLSPSHVHRILTNSVYAGFFYTLDGDRYELDPDLPRILTEEDFERVQILLGSRRTSRPRSHSVYPFTSLIKTTEGETLGVDAVFHLVCDCNHKFSYRTSESCPSCNSTIDRLKKPRYRHYRYYFSRKGRDGNAMWIRSIEEKKVRGLLADHIRKNVIIHEDFAQWASKFVSELQDQELKEAKRETRKRDQVVKELAQKRRKAREIYMEGLISKKEFQDEIEILDHTFERINEPAFAISKDWASEIAKIGNLSNELLILLSKGADSEINRAIKVLGITMIWDGETLIFEHSAMLRKVLALSRKIQRLKQDSPNLKTVLANTGPTGEP